MKKLVFSLMAVASLALVGCSDDDDENKCASCELLGVSVEACDNGNGTVTVSSMGESQVLPVEELDGQTAAEYVEALEQGCGLLSN
jgi:uncharacterized lipoprotein NlpE involved in copper resistance